jgi:signal transduction histidine kinase
MFQHTGLGLRLPPDVETAAYRIVQEALTNVARHAQVREVAVRVWADAATLTLEIADQGVGFKAATVPGTSGGLLGMRERAMLLGGHLTVESAPGAGTSIMAELPLTGHREIGAQNR